MRRAGAGRAVAVLVLVALAALIPLLGPSTALHGTGEAGAPGAGGIALLRTVLFAALCVPVGELFVNRLARSVPGAEEATGRPLAVPRSWSPFAAVVGFVAALGLASVVATGKSSSRAACRTWTSAGSTRPGTASSPCSRSTRSWWRGCAPCRAGRPRSCGRWPP
ncbi:hypothetical protein SPURM210S_00244 [Streptomyces purpurascens]